MIKFDALAAVDRKDLVRLAELLEAGLLTPPLSALSLRDHIAAVHAVPIAQCLGELIAREHAAPPYRAPVSRLRRRRRTGWQLLIACRNGRQRAGRNRWRARYRRRHAAAVRQGRVSERWPLVSRSVRGSPCSRPWLTGSTTTILSRQPCASMSRRQHTAILPSTATSSGASRTNSCATSGPGTDCPGCTTIPGPSILRAVRLARCIAKCVVIDGREALVTSANFTEAAQERNIEIGLLVSSQPVARQIEEHFMSLIVNEDLVRLPLS